MDLVHYSDTLAIPDFFQSHQVGKLVITGVFLGNIMSSTFGLNTCNDSGFKHVPILVTQSSILKAYLLDNSHIDARTTSVFPQ